ncbi:MAG: adenylate/guanylate cyclase domain-containing protein [Chloroflexota bacterium]
MTGGTSDLGLETRKTVTILFIDAVSSTTLAEQMDPEYVRALMTRYFAVMRAAIESHGGTIEKYIGDAVMAVFGVPHVHEDDALRACRAALDIRHNLTQMEPPLGADGGVVVKWRMGINTGPVVTGDLTPGQRMVTGDAVNVASRLEAAADPGEIVIGAETHALVRDGVSAEPLAALSLKGKTSPVMAWRLLAIEEVPHRRARPQEAPLVGRQTPLDLLNDAFSQTVEGRVCHLFTILGVAGIGKSRLVDEFISGLGDQAAVAKGHCLAYGSGITYWPVAEALRSGIVNAEPKAGGGADALVTGLAAVLADEADVVRISAAVGSLMSINTEPHDQEELFWSVRKTFEALARRRPLVLVLDDIHWGEPTFLDLVDHIAERTRDAPILLIAMARLELLEKRPGWAGDRRWATTVQLPALSDVESEQLVGSLLGQAALPAGFHRRIAQVAEGNPLFVEELLAKLIDDGVLRRGGSGWTMAADLQDLAMPGTIQALLAARLDGLDAGDRTVIERAAVEGKAFHRGAVTALVHESLRDEVDARLANLVRMQLVRPESTAFAGDAAFAFRHQLIRDAAYQGLAKKTRAELHQRLAAWLEKVVGNKLLEYAEIIAYHLEQAYRYRTELGPSDAAAAQLAARAGGMLAQASRRAEARGDIRASVDLMDRAADLLPPSADRRLLVAQVAPNLLFVGDGPRAESLLQSVAAESEDAGDARGAAWARLGLMFVQSSTQSSSAADYARDAEALRDELAELGDTEGAQQAELLAALGLFVIGRAGEGGARAEAVLDSVPSSSSGSLVNRARALRALAAMAGPMPTDRALRLIEEELASGLQLPGGPSGPTRMLCLQGRFPEARAALARATDEMAEHGGRILTPSEAHEMSGMVGLLAGDSDQAVHDLQVAYDEKMAAGDPAGAYTTATALAEAYLQVENLDEGWRYAEMARRAASPDDVVSQGRSRQIQARILSERGQHDEALALAREAVAIVAPTDYLVVHGDALVHLAHVLHAVGEEEQAVAAADEAALLYDRKGAVFPARRTRDLILDWGEAMSSP